MIAGRTLSVLPCGASVILALRWSLLELFYCLRSESNEILYQTVQFLIFAVEQLTQYSAGVFRLEDTVGVEEGEQLVDRHVIGALWIRLLLVRAAHAGLAMGYCGRLRFVQTRKDPLRREHSLFSS